MEKGGKIVLSRDKANRQMGRNYRVTILGSICLNLLVVRVLQRWNRQLCKVVSSLPLGMVKQWRDKQVPVCSKARSCFKVDVGIEDH